MGSIFPLYFMTTASSLSLCVSAGDPSSTEMHHSHGIACLHPIYVRRCSCMRLVGNFSWNAWYDKNCPVSSIKSSIRFISLYNRGLNKGLPSTFNIPLCQKCCCRTSLPHLGSKTGHSDRNCFSTPL